MTIRVVDIIINDITNNGDIMIQLNDVFSTVINPFHIVYFNIIDNPIIVGTIKCVFNHNCHLTLKYDSPEALKLDYNKLLTATNA